MGVPVQREEQIHPSSVISFIHVLNGFDDAHLLGEGDILYSVHQFK